MIAKREVTQTAALQQQKEMLAERWVLISRPTNERTKH